MIGVNNDPSIELAGEVRLRHFAQLRFDSRTRTLLIDSDYYHTIIGEDPMPAETTFTLQTWNVWYGGREVDFGQEKQYAIAAQFPADVLALQECWGSAAENLAPKLLADHAQRGWDTAVLSTGQLTPVDTSTLPYAQAALVRPLPDSPRILVWSVHLAPYPYAVYRALQGEGQEVADAEEAPRLQQIEEILSETARISAEVDEDDLPVVICGDFNTPSTGDWAARTDRPDIAWRSPDALLAAGFTDTFRAIHPDPVAAPADTWSPIEPLTHAGHEEKPEPGRADGAEPRDRIDFIFSRGLDIVDSVMRGCSAEGLTEDGFVDVGGRCELIPNQRQNRFPSDHQLVETRFTFRGLIVLSRSAGCHAVDRTQGPVFSCCPTSSAIPSVRRAAPSRVAPMRLKP